MFIESSATGGNKAPVYNGCQLTIKSGTLRPWKRDASVRNISLSRAGAPCYCTSFNYSSNFITWNEPPSLDTHTQTHRMANSFYHSLPTLPTVRARDKFWFYEPPRAKHKNERAAKIKLFPGAFPPTVTLAQQSLKILTPRKNVAQ